MAEDSRKKLEGESQSLGFSLLRGGNESSDDEEDVGSGLHLSVRQQMPHRLRCRVEREMVTIMRVLWLSYQGARNEQLWWLEHGTAGKVPPALHTANLGSKLNPWHHMWREGKEREGNGRREGRKGERRTWEEMEGRREKRKRDISQVDPISCEDEPLCSDPSQPSRSPPRRRQRLC